MTIKAILFDLDGTLLPMNEEVFTKGYFKLLAQKLATIGYKPDELINGIMTGISAMVNSDGKQTNSDTFWLAFENILGERVHQDRPTFDHFYENEFQQTAQFCSVNPMASMAVATAKEKGLKVVLATNPVFPAIATESRIKFAELTKEDFDYITTYENSYFCKPSLSYYQAITEYIGYSPEECLMVGNNVAEDMIAKQLGMNVFLVTDCLVNKKNSDINEFNNGNLYKLVEYLKSI